MAGIQQVSFASPYAGDEEEILRRQKIAEMLQQKALESGGNTEVMPGGFAVRKSPLEGLSRVMAGYMSGTSLQDAKTKREELARQMQADAMKWYGQQPTGTPAQVQNTSQEGTGSMDMSGTQGPQVTPGQPPTQQQQMGWAMQGMQNPMSAPIAQMEMANIRKTQEPYTLAQGAVRMGPNGPIASNPKPTTSDKPIIHDMPVGESMIQPHQYNAQTKTWEPVPGTQPQPKFARQVAPVIQTGDHSAYTNVQPDGQGGFIGLSKRSGKMEKIPQDAGVTGTGQLAPEAADAAAGRYLLDGTLPTNLGRGTQGATNTTRILNRAAEIAAQRGDTPEAQRISQLAAKASTAALTDLSKRQAQVGAFERTFSRNADLVESISAKVDRTGVPIVNKWIQAGKRAVMGDPDIVAFDAAIKGAANEYTKIVSGAMGNTALAEGEIKKIENLLSAAQTPEQVRNVLNTMRIETQNRMKGFAEEKASLMSGFQRQPAPSPGTPRVVDFNSLPK